MGQISISIVKRVAFRDSVQEFSNTYTYGGLVANPSSDSAADALIDDVVAVERAIHSSDVTFVRALMWSSGGTKAENQMIRQRNLSGVGTGSTYAPGVDKERAVLIKWPAGLDSRGRKVYLKKWYHVCGNIGSVGLTASIVSQATGFDSTQRSTIANLALGATTIGSGAWGLKAESGRERTDGGQPIAHKYLEHHQLGEAWRG